MIPQQRLVLLADPLAQLPRVGRREGLECGLVAEQARFKVRALTPGQTGGELFQQGLDSLDKDGRLVICGGHAGEVVPFDIIPFFRMQKSIIGSFVYTRTEVESCLELARRGQIVPLVYKTFPLTEAREAMATMERREHFGKIVLKP